MKPIISAITTRGHEAGGVADLAGLPASADGLTTFEMYGSRIGFLHPREAAFSDDAHPMSWKTTERDGWYRDWLDRTGALEAWFARTPDPCASVYLHVDAEPWPVVLPGDHFDASTDERYHGALLSALPMIYARIASLARTYWPESTTYLGHTNHVRQPPFPLMGLTKDWPGPTATIARDLYLKLLPLGYIMPVKAYFRSADDRPRRWGPQESAQWVSVGIAGARTIVGDGHICLNASIHGPGDDLVTVENMAGVFIAAEMDPCVLFTRVWGANSHLISAHGNSWSHKVSAIMLDARAMAEEYLQAMVDRGWAPG